eukprot:jgi/Psemu1/305639/fgenesh1_kg.209_\
MVTQQQRRQQQMHPFHKPYYYHESSLRCPSGIGIPSRSPAKIPSASSWSWHPIQSSPSEDLWELPACTSSMSTGSSSDDRDDFVTTTGCEHELHREFSVYRDPNEDDDDYNDYYYEQPNYQQQSRGDESLRMPSPTVTVRTTPHYRSSTLSSSLPSSVRNNDRNRRRSTMGVLSGKKCVLGDATNTVQRRRSESSSTRPIRRSYFN